MNTGKIISTTKRDGVLVRLIENGERLTLTVVDVTTGAPSGTVSFPKGAAGAIIWTIQAVYDKDTPKDTPTSSTDQKPSTTRTARSKKSKKG